jgi:predicted dehydrogenase
MKTLIVGLGVQGNKRINFLSKRNTITLDPLNPKADYKKINDVNLRNIKKAYICTPEIVKFQLVRNLLENNINVLVEKPFILKNFQKKIIKKILKKNKSILYVAYNHRFETHIKTVKKILEKKHIGKIYSVEFYYGNGTVKLWKDSWREKNLFSIADDLGVHLLDIFFYWFNFLPSQFFSVIKSKNEAKCYDYFSFLSNENFKSIFTVSIIDWKNKFEANIIGSKGSIHISCLCKWGPSILRIRKRKFPSGKPTEKVKVLRIEDPTWKAEEKYFNKIIKKKISNFENNNLIEAALKKIKC